MAANESDGETLYRVVMNHEEQYSIWPVAREVPNGWHVAGPVGKRDDCLAYIKEVWTDLTPLSVRRRT